MSEQDIDFIIHIQNKLGTEIIELFRIEKERIKKEQVENRIEWNLKHFDLERDEVKQRLYAVDFLNEDQDISEDRVDEVFWNIAKEKKIRPNISKSEITELYKDTEEYFKTSEWKDKFWATKQREGMSEQQIEDEWQKDQSSKTMAEVEIERYIRLGYDIKD